MPTLPVYGKRNQSFAKAVHFDNFCPQDYVILDIRQTQDFLERHLPYAEHIDGYEKLIKVIEENVEKKILLQCYSGHTASLLGNDLVLSGYKNIYFLDEYLEDFWTL
ncbi:hypothetical protein CCZ01_02370 [Helicobacter monodelphidis]|nr:hypothetical protein CCZ01_02370 [Helicobacter sp. 15-1451]